MKPNKNKGLLIGISVTILLGVGGYFAYRMIKANRDKKKAEADANALASTPPTTQTNSTPKPQIIANPFKSREELRTFQNWVLTMYPFDRAILGSNGADGDWGKNSANAWTKYGNDYKLNRQNIANQFGLGNLVGR